jgi:hypothetical protein
LRKFGLKPRINTDFKPVRADVFVETHRKKFQSSVQERNGGCLQGLAVRKDYVAPPGLKIILVWVSTKMSRRTALATATTIAQPFMAVLVHFAIPILVVTAVCNGS